MKLLAGLIGIAACMQQAVSLTPPPGADALAKCSNVIVRKEIRSLSADEWNTYKDAVNSAYNDRWIDWFGFLHEQVAPVVHSNAVFLVFHRKLTRDYEKILQRYSPSLAVPYWNEVLNYQDPTSSPVLSDNYFGGDGDAANDGCVPSGIAKDWTLVFPQSHCLRRKYGEGMSMKSWYSPEFVTSILQSSGTYADFRSGLENTVHGLPHLTLGGDMNTMHSPLDPVFWLHHANVDRLFAQWQAADPEKRTYEYNGYDIQNKAVSLDDYLTSTTTHVYEVMRLGYGDMCYTYDTLQSGGASSNSLSRRQKCIPRPTKATQTVKSLPKTVLEKYYPSFAKSGVSSVFEIELPDIDPRHPMASDINATAPATPWKPSEKMRGHMPKPATLTDEYIEMMYGNKSEVRSWERLAAEMVDELNAANYLSPYLYDRD
ncbi:hypothetical protein IWW36_000081 [Coemansia brasiliensis]|uniref:Tyrosinase copper-binding domain-containing protein n=1 Tax=Coemansia brasiliensis TaxID=2650707 RepID=A0A9W8IGJ8_9FUNG|nr:hypothetical protein IWW36_000081 [Coemansia brasiliensis]